MRERLLKEVVSSCNAQVVPKKPKAKTLFETRAFLTANFLPPLPGVDKALLAKDNTSCPKRVSGDPRAAGVAVLPAGEWGFRPPNNLHIYVIWFRE